MASAARDRKRTELEKAEGAYDLRNRSYRRLPLLPIGAVGGCAANVTNSNWVCQDCAVVGLVCRVASAASGRLKVVVQFRALRLSANLSAGDRLPAAGCGSLKAAHEIGSSLSLFRGQRITCFAPRLHPAIERYRALKSHRAKRRGGEGRDAPEFAANQYPLSRVFHMESRVCPGVCSASRRRCPITSSSPPSSRGSTKGAGLDRCITTGTSSWRASCRVAEK